MQPNPQQLARKQARRRRVLEDIRVGIRPWRLTGGKIVSHQVEDIAELVDWIEELLHQQQHHGLILK